MKQGKALTLLSESTPLSKFLKSLSNPKLSRTAASTVAQLRLTHFPLNRYLKRIGRADNTRCPACGEDDKDINHFLLRCQTMHTKGGLLPSMLQRNASPSPYKRSLETRNSFCHWQHTSTPLEDSQDQVSCYAPGWVQDSLM